MSAFYRCDYCGSECAPGTGIPSLPLSVSPTAVDKKWAKDHSEHRTSQVRVLIGLDGIAADGERFGHDLCDECIAAHLRKVLEYLVGEAS